MNRWLVLVLVVVVGVTALSALAWVFQRRMIYLPFGGDPGGPGAALSGARSVCFETADGLLLAGWYVPPPADGPGPAVLVCNGNAGNRSFRAPLGETFRELGLGVLLFDYRGYGGNPGTPSEAGLIADARAARAWLEARPEVDPERIVLFGESLGAAVAVAVAAERAPAGLVLRSPFASLHEVARVHYAVVPRALLRDRWPSVRRIADVVGPLLVLAGSDDRVVPAAHSRRLFEAAPGPDKRYVEFDGLGHNDGEFLGGERMTAELRRFLDDALR